MLDLSNSIYAYYLDNFDLLSPEKRFHFASRLYLWSQDQTCRDKLQTLRPWFTHNEQPDAAVATVSKTPATMSKNAARLRQIYFAKYPKLQAYNNALFRINFLKTIYSLDASASFGKLFGQAEPAALFKVLASDHDAIRILSTHAINFFYLYAALIGRTPEAVEPEHYLKISQDGYDLDDLIQLQLKIYLLTHCIIGATQFYYRPIPEAHTAIYRQMVDALEILVEQRFQDINLDNKFEFLTCCKLVGHPSRLETRIYAEAEQSLSSDGEFLVDAHNNNPQRDNASLDKSEHRNVLFLLANRDYLPLAASSSK